MSMWQNYFKNRNSNTKEINKQKSANSQQNLAVISSATDSENISVLILQGKGQIKIWQELSSLGLEPTFKCYLLLNLWANVIQTSQECCLDGSLPN